MKKTTLLLLLLATVALAGCQTLKAINPFHHREPQYKAARQEQPLEVPPGMDQPPTTEALAIPNAGKETTATAQPEAPPTGQEAGESVAGASSMSSSLSLSDTPDSAWHRVGLALQRGGVGTVTASDATARTYQVAVDATVTTKPKGGFFHRLFHHSRTQSVQGSVTISVTPAGTGSRIGASGNPAAVAKVMAVLRQRL